MGIIREGNTIEPISILLLLCAGGYVGWNIGANDTANCIGTTVGCGLISFKRAAYLVAGFAVLGALLQGQDVMVTIGKGIVKDRLDYVAVLVAMICAGFFVTLATFLRVPTSTSQAIVGGVLGIGFATNADIDFKKFVAIADSWVICPFLVMGLSFGLSHLLRFLLRSRGRGSLYFQNIMGWLAISSGCYVAYSLGASNAGNAVGPIANLGIVHPTLLLAIGGLSMAAGAVTYGRRVADTIGKSITPLDIPGAFAAQISSAFGMHLFSMFGIPVSSSSAIVGAIVGVGLVKGAGAVSKKTLLVIVIGWIVTPCLTATSSYLLYKLLT